MNKADEMFKKENYKLNDTWGENVITYTDKSNDKEYIDNNIHFWKDTKTISKNGDAERICISMQELQAINEKVKELRMELIDLLIQLAFEQRTSISKDI